MFEGLNGQRFREGFLTLNQAPEFPGELFKAQIAGPHSEFSDSFCLGEAQNLLFCLAPWRSRFENPWFVAISSCLGD